MIKPETSEKKTDRRSSLEQLDRLVTITAPVWWIDLVAVYVVIGVALIWAIWGAIPTKVQGHGILVSTGGVQEVVARTSGKVTAVLVKPGEMVQAGQVVARIVQPTLASQIENTRKELDSLKNMHHQAKEFYARERSLQGKNLLAQRRNLQGQMGDIQQRRQWLSQRLKNQEELLAQGLITDKTLLDTREQMQNASEDLRKAQVSREKTNVDEIQMVTRQERDLFELSLKILETSDKLESLIKDMEYRGIVKSDFSGRVLEAKVSEGAEVTPGSRIISLDLMGGNLRAVLYVSIGHGGKKVKPGMPIQISPRDIKREQYGSMLGEVRSISPYPATPEAMLNVLRNEGLVKEFAQGGPAIAIYADLLADPATISGFKWTSREGPPFKMDLGRVVLGEVVVGEQRPISLVIPYIKRVFGL
jgi:HlyD family secretion protein